MRPALLVVGLGLATACSPAGWEPGTDPASLVVTTATASVELTVEVADTPEDRATGLMWREELSPYDGMAFVWTEPTDATFWMKNTLIPLSIAFWDQEGRIVRILDMEPCGSDSCPRYAARTPIVGAVEVDQGLFDEHGIAVGDRVRFAEAAA